MHHITVHQQVRPDPDCGPVCLCLFIPSLLPINSEEPQGDQLILAAAAPQTQPSFIHAMAAATVLPPARMSQGNLSWVEESVWSRLSDGQLITSCTFWGKRRRVVSNSNPANPPNERAGAKTRSWTREMFWLIENSHNCWWACQFYPWVFWTNVRAWSDCENHLLPLLLSQLWTDDGSFSFFLLFYTSRMEKDFNTRKKLLLIKLTDKSQREGREGRGAHLDSDWPPWWSLSALGV